MSDRHVRRSGDDYTAAFSRLLPSGAGWPRDRGSTLMRLVRGLCQVWGDPVDARAADLLERESDPRLTVELLPEWERAWGLPEPCLNEPISFADRRKMLLWKMTLLGGQSREFFYDIADMLGYTITIREWAPFMAGISRCGNTHAQNVATGDSTPGRMRWYIGAPENRFYWTVAVSAKSLIWFRAASGRAGVDPMLRIGLASDLECLFDQYKPAHTKIVFDYSASIKNIALSPSSLAVASPNIGSVRISMPPISLTLGSPRLSATPAFSHT